MIVVAAVYQEPGLLPFPRVWLAPASKAPPKLAPAPHDFHLPLSNQVRPPVDEGHTTCDCGEMRSMIESSPTEKQPRNVHSNDTEEQSRRRQRDEG
jgi:hypothetical protein